jgi:hypothetical protein
LGGIGFRDDPGQVELADLDLRPGERFVYEYDFTDGWQHDVRVEQVLCAEPGRAYPVCTGGRRAGPPEGCGGPWAFMEQAQAHHFLAALGRAAEIVGEVLRDTTVLGDYREELARLLPWLTTEDFDRRALNRTLSTLSLTEERAA